MGEPDRCSRLAIAEERRGYSCLAGGVVLGFLQCNERIHLCKMASHGRRARVHEWGGEAGHSRGRVAWQEGGRE